MESLTFANIGVQLPFLDIIQRVGYTIPTPIQLQAVPILLSGNDLIGCAQTGTGKTCAFALPILQQLYIKHIAGSNPSRDRRIRVLAMSPTRELATQVHESFLVYAGECGLKSTVIFGGVPQGPQTASLDRGTDILVATPGRLLDLHEQGFISFENLEHFVLDEADQMLDMGFIHDIRRILALLPDKNSRQNAFFSATVPPEIVELSTSILREGFRHVSIDPDLKTTDRVTQEIYHVARVDRFHLLMWLLKNNPPGSTLIFVRTKIGAERVAKMLRGRKINADSIHGGKSQNQRTTALNNFKIGKTRALVATDMASRGLDIDALTYVVNYDLPVTPDTYVHRIGRTGRADKHGKSISICIPDQLALLKQIEKAISQAVPVGVHHFRTEDPEGDEEHQQNHFNNNKQFKQQRPQQQGQRPKVESNNPFQQATNQRHTREGQTNNNLHDNQDRFQNQQPDRKVYQNPRFYRHNANGRQQYQNQETGQHGQFTQRSQRQSDSNRDFAPSARRRESNGNWNPPNVQSFPKRNSGGSVDSKPSREFRNNRNNINRNDVHRNEHHKNEQPRDTRQNQTSRFKEQQNNKQRPTEFDGNNRQQRPRQLNHQATDAAQPEGFASHDTSGFNINPNQPTQNCNKSSHNQNRNDSYKNNQNISTNPREISGGRRPYNQPRNQASNQDHKPNRQPRNNDRRQNAKNHHTTVPGDDLHIEEVTPKTTDESPKFPNPEGPSNEANKSAKNRQGHDAPRGRGGARGGGRGNFKKRNAGVNTVASSPPEHTTSVEKI